MAQDIRGVNAGAGHSEARQRVPAGRVVRLGYGRALIQVGTTNLGIGLRRWLDRP